ncbi:hypothetical protein WJX72_005104 [[Myrmecia] bisecta]|uniref:RRM domain-containing protein n=1 Tax=[Myrmecia] bisecta TaxID=41462 RepID=A0AAW1P0S9_9CHLO
MLAHIVPDRPIFQLHAAAIRSGLPDVTGTEDDTASSSNTQGSSEPPNSITSGAPAADAVSQAPPASHQSSPETNTSRPLSAHSAASAGLPSSSSATRLDRRGQGTAHDHEDIFSSVGGLEMGHEAEPGQLNRAVRSSTPPASASAPPGSSGIPSNLGMPRTDSHGNLGRLPEWPLGDRPSRTLFVANVSPSTEDGELHTLFEPYGEIRTLYTATKQRGFVVVSFFDLRAACLAMHALQRWQLHGQALDIHFSGQKDAGMDKDADQGIVTVFNVDPNIQDAELLRRFSAYGDVKSVQHASGMETCRMVEFYDIRHAEAALQALNRGSSASPSKRPTNSAGYATADTPAVPMAMRNVQSSHVLNNLMSSSRGAEDAWGRPHSWDPAFVAREQLAAMLPPEGLSGINTSQMMPAGTSAMPEISALLQQRNRLGSQSALDQLEQAALLQQQHAQQAQQGAVQDLINSGGYLSQQQIADLRHQLLVGRGPGGVASGGLASTNSASHPNLAMHYAASMTGSSPPRSSTDSLELLGANAQQAQHAQQLLALQGAGAGYGGSGVIGEPLVGGLARRGISMSTGDLAALYEAQAQAGSRGLDRLSGSSLHSGLRSIASTSNMWSPGGAYSNALGSSPPAQGRGSFRPKPYGLQPEGSWAYQNEQAVLRAQLGLNMGMQGSMGAPPFLPHSPQAAQQYLHSGVLAQRQVPRGNQGPFGPNSASLKLQMGLAAAEARRKDRRLEDNSGGGRLSRRTADPVAEAERKAQQDKLYALDLDKVLSGEDKRTTLMIKNIPNKYTQKMLLTTIDEQFRGTYDFFYLPIDFKNKCNVGYAFINLVLPEYIVPLTQRFNHKKWEKFNSEKVCHISYARIQGKQQLVTHFQNSSLLHEDKRCRPILFRSEGPLAGDPEPFPVGPNARVRST